MQVEADGDLAGGNIILTLTDYAMLSMIASVPLGLVALYLKAIRGDAETFRKAFGKRLEKIESRVVAVEADKVDHVNWVRVAASQRNAIDRIGRQLAEMGGKLDATVGTGAAMSRLATSIDGYVKANSNG